MPRFVKKTSNKTGLPSGALVHIGEKKQEHTRITVMGYNRQQFAEQCLEDVETIFLLRLDHHQWCS